LRILVVEDEQRVARFIQRGLKERSYSVDVAGDGEQGLFLAQTNEYNLIVLDILLPKMDGIQVLRELRRSGNKALVLLLTARGGVQDRVAGLDEGADDYLAKPFAFDEFLARVRALLRRNRPGEASKLQAADLVLDLLAHRVERGGKRIELTSREFALLEYLLRNAGTVLTRTQIAEHVWDLHFDSLTNVIDVTVHHLREKIDHGASVRLIHTVRGVGYVLQEEP
jgi:heavy metal response regulator